MGCLLKNSPHNRTSFTSGLILGVVAYLLWGAFPLYFALLESVSPMEVVTHRVIWSLVFLAIVLTIAREWSSIKRATNPRSLRQLALAAIFLSVNWLVYVYAINVDQVVQASLGYFINPLISVGLGVIVLKERMRNGQWAAVGIAVVAVLILTISYGEIPWIALILGFSFGFYGLLKKQAGVAALPSLTIETMVLALPALIFLLTTEFTGNAAFVIDGWWISILLIMLGPVTALPLLAFGGAANRIPLSTLGVIQYITPILQFILGVFVFKEAMTAGLWFGFVLVWIALVIFTLDELKYAKSNSRLAGLEVTEPT